LVRIIVQTTRGDVMQIDRGGDRALYRQIADYLRGEIEDGRLEQGARLPTETDLMEQFGAARGTCRQALAVLTSEGLVETQQGRGVFVRIRPPLIRTAGDRFSRKHRRAGKGAYQAEVENQGYSFRQEIRELGTTKAPDHVAERLGVRRGVKVFVRRRRMWADEVPMQLADSFFRTDMVKGTAITEEDSGPGGSYARLEESGYRLARFREEISARMPTPDELRVLRLGPGVPIVHLIRIAYDKEGTALEVFDSIVAADRHVFTYDIRA